MSSYHFAKSQYIHAIEKLAQKQIVLTRIYLEKLLEANPENLQAKRLNLILKPINYYETASDVEQESTLINLGCGNSFHPKWINVDFYSSTSNVYSHDLTLGVPFRNESFDVVYHSHLLEHFSKRYAPIFMEDCYRVLKVGGILRVVVPDLESITRQYIKLLEYSLSGNEDAQKRYEWIMLELFDQMVRNKSGGEMINYWRQDPMPVEEFVFERLGSEVKSAVASIRSHRGRNVNPNSTPDPLSDPHEIGKFRLSGEIHQWMYDRYSLTKLFREVGFDDIKVCRADDSSIPDFNSYLLDIEADGSVRKPDSLFMEGKKFSKERKFFTSKADLPSKSHNGPGIAQFCMQDYGGAGTAALRLHKGLISTGVNSNLYVQNIKKWNSGTNLLSEYSSCAVPGKKFCSPEWKSFHELNKKLLAPYKNRPSGLEMFSVPWSASRMEQIDQIREADIFHLHWIGGTISISDEIQNLKNKKVVWTLHDMNPFTGGCHYSGSCNRYKEFCGRCPQLGSDQENDLSREIWKLKKLAYKQLDINVVVLCNWMADCVKKSSLLSSFSVHVIPNGLPTEVFKPYQKIKIRESLGVSKDSFVVLFGAESIENKRKGFDYLLNALNVIKSTNFNDDIVFVMFGSLNSNVIQKIGFKTLELDYVEKESELALIYSMADVTVIPSIEDNLPNIVSESLACGTPVVGFRNGGIPEMIEHKRTGYLCESKDVKSLVRGILWARDQKHESNKIRHACRAVALERFSLSVQAKTYKKLYDDIMTH